MKYQLLKLSLIILSGFVLTSVTACNTVDGAGRDIEHAGEAVQDAAD